MKLNNYKTKNDLFFSTDIFNSNNLYLNKPEDLKGVIHPRRIKTTDKFFNSENLINEDFPSPCSRAKLKDFQFQENHNICFKNCKNINKIKILENKIKVLIETNLNLKKINEYLIKSLNLKEDLFLNVTHENKNLKVDYKLLNSHLESRKEVSNGNVINRPKSQNLKILNTNFNNYHITNFERKDNSKESFINSNLTTSLHKNKKINDFNKLNLLKTEKSNDSNINYFLENKKNVFKHNLTAKNKDSNNTGIKYLIDPKKNKFTENETDSKISKNINNNYNENSDKNSLKFQNHKEIKIETDYNMEREISNFKDFDYFNRSKENSEDLFNCTTLKKEITSPLNIKNIDIKKNFLIENNFNFNTSKETENNVEKNKDNIFEDHNISNGKVNSNLNLNPNKFSFRHSQTFKFESSKNNILPKKDKIRTLKGKSYYERLSILVRRNKNTKLKEQNLINFLSLKEQTLERFFNNEILKELRHLTTNDQDFLDCFKKSDDEKLLKFSDTISTLTNNLENSIFLILRIKKLMKHFEIIKKMDNINQLSSFFSKIFCEIFDCEEALIYSYDKLSEKLILSSGEIIKNKQSSINKNYGMIGHVFNTGELIRIDNPLTDKRFSTNDQNLSDYKIKNILCGAVKEILEEKERIINMKLFSYDEAKNENKNSEICSGKIQDKINIIINADNENINASNIAVVQLINKRKLPFNNDDQEIFTFLSNILGQYASYINILNENNNYISKLKIFLEFLEDNNLISSIEQLTFVIEALVTSMFSCNSAQLLIFDSKKDEILRITKYEKKIKKKNLGIIGYVYEKKEYYGTDSILNCIYYDNTIDLETTISLLTYPILEKNKLIGILQFSFNEKLNKKKRPKQTDEDLIFYICKSCSFWLNNLNNIQIKK